MRTDAGGAASRTRPVAPLVVSWLVAAALTVCGLLILDVVSGVVTVSASLREAVVGSGGLFVGLVAGGAGAVLLPLAVATRPWPTWLFAGLPGPALVALFAGIRGVARAVSGAGGTAPAIGMVETTLAAASVVVGAALGSLIGGLLRRALA